MPSVDDTAIPDVKLITPERHRDGRGHLAEIWHRARFVESGVASEFVQENLVHSLHRGTVRGLHYQRAPEAQGKLVTVVSGAVLDVVLDLRRNSTAYGHHVAVELSAANGTQLWAPPGLAHGYCALADDTSVLYRMSRYYAPAFEAGILWCDPALSISWPVTPGQAILSEKDRAWPSFAEWEAGQATS
jgi:dTDP-4-dehydrorhamnose 3,5-epimerase